MEQGKSEAVVQYTIPAAAWKISYRLRMAEGRETELQGFAIVDNNTDEDWNDFRVCVVTGEPITFSTDLAQSKTPRRDHVALVSETALGAVEVESPVFAGESMLAATLSAEAPDMARGKLRQMSARRAAMVDMDAAETTVAEVQEVGDFNIFESHAAVTIPAKRSTVIPVFQAEVSEAKSVLHYKHENHPDRPFRSIDFTNQTDISLGRGVCTVYEEGAYAGNCIIPATKPSESRLLPHALETGVTVHREQKRQRNKVVGLRLAEGFCYTSTRERRESHYHVRSSRDQRYELVLDHVFTLTEPELEVSCIDQGEAKAVEATSRLTDGIRYTLDVAPKAEVLLKVVEQRVAQSKIQLVTKSKNEDQHQIDWLQQNLVATNGPLADHEGIRNCLDIQQQLEAKLTEIAEAEREVERFEGRQKRLRENIKSGGQDELTSRWRSELDEAEQGIRQIEETLLPTLRSEGKTLRKQLTDALKSLSAEWSTST